MSKHSKEKPSTIALGGAPLTENLGESDMTSMSESVPKPTETWLGTNLTIGELHAPVPIVQGGMGVGISMSRLASAVANAGGIGVISAAMIGKISSAYNKFGDAANAEAIKDEIAKARLMCKDVPGSSNLIGVNLMVAGVEYAKLVKATLDAGADFIFSGAGLPLSLPKYLEAHHTTKLVPIISSAKAARILVKKWMTTFKYMPDAFVLEGPAAGGHLGFKPDNIFDPDYRLDKLVVEVRDELDTIEATYGTRIPLVAGGGLFTGADIARTLALGADGVQIATRFIATPECDADEAFKQAVIAAKPEDIEIIASPVGMPGRALKGDFVNEAREGKRHPKACAYDCIITCKKQEAPYCIAKALINAYRGRIKDGFVFVGAHAGRVKEMTTVNKLIAELKEEYVAATMVAVG